MAATKPAGSLINRPPLRPAWTAAALFVIALTFYVFTLQPSLAWGDGTKIQREAISGESFILAEMVEADFAPDPFPFARLGVAAWDHPLYVILTHTAVRALPGVNSLWLVNFASALFGAGALVLVHRLIWEQTGSLAASVVAAAALGVSHTFWFHSVTPEVYTLLGCLLLVVVWAYLRWRATGRPGWLAASAFALGMSAATHLLAFLIVPVIVPDLILGLRGARALSAGSPGNPGSLGDGAQRWPGRNAIVSWLLVAGLAFVVGFMPYLVQLARMLRTFPPSRVMGPAFGSTFFSTVTSTTPTDLLVSLGTLTVYLGLQFNPVGAALGGWGLWQGRRGAPALWRLALAGFIVYGLFGVLYRVSDQFAFFQIAYMFFALALGLGLADGLARRRSWSKGLQAVAAIGVAAMPVLYGAAPSLARAAGMTDASLGIPAIGVGVRDGLAYYVNPNKRGEVGAYRFGERILSQLPPKALVLAEWYTDTDEYFILRYFIAVEGRRPDVQVEGWPTVDPFTFDSAAALTLVEESLPVRPVYLASLSDEFYNASSLVQRHCIVVEFDLYRVLPEPNSGGRCIPAERGDGD